MSHNRSCEITKLRSCLVGLSAIVILIATSLAFTTVARNAIELVFVTPLVFAAEYTGLGAVTWATIDQCLERWLLKSNTRIYRKRLGPLEGGKPQRPENIS